MLDFGPRGARGLPRPRRGAEGGPRSRTPHDARRSTGVHVALLFEKPSLRTRSTFQIAVRELGGDMIEPPDDVALGGRESIEDVARNLERWVAAAVVRTFAQARLEEFAAAAPRLRVVNALTDEEHPVPGAGRLPDADRTASATSTAARLPSSATATTSPRRWRRRCVMLGGDGARRLAEGIRAAGRRCRRASRRARAPAAGSS